MGKLKKSGFVAILLVFAMVLPGFVVQAASPKLNKTKVTLTAGSTQKLTLKNASGSITWTTSSKKVATVSKKGVVTAKKAGSAVITATNKGKKYVCIVTVTKGPELNKSKVTLNIGETFKLKLQKATASAFVSENSKIASVSSNGVIKAKAKGKTTITVLDKKNNAYTCKVTVNAASSNNSGISSKDNITLTLWDIAVEGDGNRPGYDAALTDLKAKYPNITIQETVTENYAYKTKIKAAVGANELPDIFFTWSGAFLGDFVDAGVVYCLDDALKGYIKSGEVTEAMLGNSTYNGKHYGVPTTLNVVALFANMDLLKEVGYDHIPKTAEELEDCCYKLVDAGIIPFGCAGRETWCVSEYLEPIIEKTIGGKALKDIFSGKSSWNNEGVSNAVTTFQRMIRHGYFDPNGIVLGNEEVKYNFMSGKYAFYQNGTWNCGSFSNKERVKFTVGVGEFPVLDSKASSLGQFIGGPSDTLAVSNGKNSKIAAEYAVEFGRLVCHYGYQCGAGLPAWKVWGDTSTILPLVRDVANLCAKAKSFVLFGDNAMTPNEANIYLDYVSCVYGLEIDGAGFIANLKSELG